MNRRTEVAIALTVSLALSPICGWLGSHASELFRDESGSGDIAGNHPITCPADAAMVEQLDPSISDLTIGITERGSICEFR